MNLGVELSNANFSFISFSYVFTNISIITFAKTSRLIVSSEIFLLLFMRSVTIFFLLLLMELV